MVTLEAVKADVVRLHDGLVLPNRYILHKANRAPYTSYGGCYRALSDTLNMIADPKNWGAEREQFKGAYLSLIFHGDGAPMTFDALRSMEAFNACMLEHKIPYNKFTGTERSKRWVSFLLSDQSPWQALLPSIEELDTDFINNTGFIFKDCLNIPKKLCYNFALAIRYPWEITRGYELFLRLCDEGIPPTTALYVSMNFNLNPKAETIDGPYDVQYPWSFLEETGLEAAGRFILCKPGELDPHKSAVEPNNVGVLWKCNADYDASRKQTAELVDNDRLSLVTILKTVGQRVEIQRNLMGI